MQLGRKLRIQNIIQAITEKQEAREKEQKLLNINKKYKQARHIYVQKRRKNLNNLEVQFKLFMQGRIAPEDFKFRESSFVGLLMERINTLTPVERNRVFVPNKKNILITSMLYFDRWDAMLQWANSFSLNRMNNPIDGLTETQLLHFAITRTFLNGRNNFDDMCGNMPLYLLLISPDSPLIAPYILQILNDGGTINCNDIRPLHLFKHLLRQSNHRELHKVLMTTHPTFDIGFMLADGCDTMLSIVHWLSSYVCRFWPRPYYNQPNPLRPFYQHVKLIIEEAEISSWNKMTHAEQGAATRQGYGRLF